MKISGVCVKTAEKSNRDKTIAEVAVRYSWIPRNVIEIYLKHYSACQLKKPSKQPVVSKPIISLGVMTRLQIDLIDMRTRPDVISIDVSYLWILNCIDHSPNFRGVTHCRPRLLYSDNGAEFIANVIVELKALFPDMCFVRGRPRHPQSQGCVERANGVLTVALGKWLVDNNSSHWSEGLLPAVYGINTRVAAATKCTLYEIVQDQDIQDEVQLPTPVEDNEDLQDEVDVTNQLNSVTSKNIVVVDPLFDNPENSTISKSLIDLSLFKHRFINST
ncbi:unnamed protein product [Didymodactylos carnosus]|uniref:Integrase catalytic domain-containing protein n=1 Tax=Didymodactylos carnosus TaxID=1234261 RepID=A0A8S2GP88_9BILA|nr:unnamed protein product [Didymodactylos carnosus]CAF3545682.1 unnamed protein product [Didymodactylos carnosus]